MYQNELYHYGVKGMKWGIRKDVDKAFRKAEKKRIRLENKLPKKIVKARGRQVVGVVGTFAGAGLLALGNSVNAKTSFDKGRKYATMLLGAATMARAYYDITTGGGLTVAAKRARKWALSMEDAFKGTKYEAITREHGSQRKMKTITLGRDRNSYDEYLNATQYNRTKA